MFDFDNFSEMTFWTDGEVFVDLGSQCTSSTLYLTTVYVHVVNSCRGYTEHFMSGLSVPTVCIFSP